MRKSGDAKAVDIHNDRAEWRHSLYKDICNGIVIAYECSRRLLSFVNFQPPFTHDGKVQSERAAVFAQLTQNHYAGQFIGRVANQVDFLCFL